MTPLNIRRRCSAATLALLLWLPGLAAATEQVVLSFLPQTGFVTLRFAGEDRDVVALAGRDDDGVPRLALVTMAGDTPRLLSWTSPEKYRPWVLM